MQECYERKDLERGKEKESVHGEKCSLIGERRQEEAQERLRL